MLDVDQQFRPRCYAPSFPRSRPNDTTTVVMGSQSSTTTAAVASRSAFDKSNSMSSPVPPGTCSTACSSGYVSADDEHGTLLAYRKGRESAFSETSSIASPESNSDTPSGTPSPGLGLALVGPFGGWAAAYDVCSSNFDGNVTDAWSSALDLSGSEVQGDAWLGSDFTVVTQKGSFGESSMLAGDRSILKDLLVHVEAAGSPLQSSLAGSWPSRLDSPSSGLLLLGSGSLMDCVDSGTDSRPLSKVYNGGNSHASGFGTAGHTVALFQQIFADGILEPAGSSDVINIVPATKIKKEPNWDQQSHSISVDTKPDPSSVYSSAKPSSRLASPTASNASALRNHHYHHNHNLSASQQNSPKSHHAAAHHQSRGRQ